MLRPKGARFLRTRMLLKRLACEPSSQISSEIKVNKPYGNIGNSGNLDISGQS